MKKREWEQYAKIVEKELKGLDITRAEEKLQLRGDTALMKGQKLYRYGNLRRRQKRENKTESLKLSRKRAAMANHR